MAVIPQSEWEQLNTVKFAALTTVTSLARNSVMHPLWVMKTLEQVDVRKQTGSMLAEQIKLVRDTFANSGVQGFYRGFWFSTIALTPSYLVYLLSYQRWKYELNSDSLPGGVRAASPFIAGILARMVSVPLHVPADVVSQRMLLPSNRGHGCAAVAREIWAQEGCRGFFRGSVATSVEFGLAAAVFWLVYENAKAYSYELSARPLGTKDREVDTFKVVPFFAGMLGGLSSGLVTLPINVVKTRMQVGAASSQAKLAKCRGASGICTSHLSCCPGICHVNHYNTFTAGVSHIYRTEGTRGFVRGCLPKLLSRGPVFAVTSLIYEVTVEASVSSKYCT
ncbi:unnamed protein product [Polarella glacialis]|uniref:Mitochondrial carrier protein n=1 Tax=Polarella glacialis TaxID=89957 RepID=A0A813FK74_POLGL|nr:unnamed protein product [Polarella glacialis]CAE8686401.1 unnamed protein product [Polarella glacialis]|mmetsp:Transcript_90031/g.162396  ORF Transcript_90031/g.162396 Transcript_90031/m.162396 type:complete len:336 (+) Transcript_90031:44-1051(+)